MPSGESEHRVHDLLRRLRPHLFATHRAVLDADARAEQAQVVVDLGDGADGRARVAVGGLLVDRNRGRQALDEVDVRLVHLAEELARVGAQRLDVAALPLRKDGVERERRLARTAEPAEDDQRVAGQVEVNALEVVFARAADDEPVIHRATLRGNAFERMFESPSLRARPMLRPTSRASRRGHRAVSSALRGPRRSRPGSCRCVDRRPSCASSRSGSQTVMLVPRRRGHALARSSGVLVVDEAATPPTLASSYASSAGPHLRVRSRHRSRRSVPLELLNPSSLLTASREYCARVARHDEARRGRSANDDENHDERHPRGDVRNPWSGSPPLMNGSVFSRSAWKTSLTPMNPRITASPYER